LIVHGAHSSLYGDGTADHLVAALPQARAVRFERSGHAPHLEEPELFNATLKNFAGRLSRARAARPPNDEEKPMSSTTSLKTGLSGAALAALTAFARPAFAQDAPPAAAGAASSAGPTRMAR
jgi:hypothetical protein